MSTRKSNVTCLGTLGEATVQEWFEVCHGLAERSFVREVVEPQVSGDGTALYGRKRVSIGVERYTCLRDCFEKVVDEGCTERRVLSESSEEDQH